MTVLKNKIRSIESIVSSIESMPSVLLGSLFTAVSEGLLADSELLIFQINAEENEFLFI